MSGGAGLAVAISTQAAVAAAAGREASLGALAAELRATAVSDGVGGDVLTRLVPPLPTGTTVYTRIGRVFGFGQIDVASCHDHVAGADLPRRPRCR